MPHIRFNDKALELRVGDTRIGTGEGVEVRLTALESRAGAEAGGGERSGPQAIITLTPNGDATIARPSGATATEDIRINNVALGAHPAPLIHGDKIEIGGEVIRFADESEGVTTVTIPALREVAKASSPKARRVIPALSAGRLVSLVDGREYPIPAAGLSIGRDAGCDVVVPSGDVSRRHAEIITGPAGYILNDLSANGVYVNGERSVSARTLAAGDVLRVGNEEFRFHASAIQAVATPTPATPASPVPSALPPSAALMPEPPAPMPVPPAPTPAPAAAAPARPALATLEIINEGVMKGVRFDVRTPLVHVGRGAHNDIAIADESVSESHAKIQKRDTGWFVVDMGSTNGTYVAGQRVVEERQLTGVVDVRFGGIKMLFRPARVLDDEGGGTRIIVGLRGSAPEPGATEPDRAIAPKPTPVEPDEAGAGVSPFVWAAVIVVIAVAILYMLKGR